MQNKQWENIYCCCCRKSPSMVSLPECTNKHSSNTSIVPTMQTLTLDDQKLMHNNSEHAKLLIASLQFKNQPSKLWKDNAIPAFLYDISLCFIWQSYRNKYRFRGVVDPPWKNKAPPEHNIQKIYSYLEQRNDERSIT